ncbi:uncharacterized protein aunip [Aulostomus maculatus]
MTSQSGLQASAQEECGVWLDTVQLKQKAKQKRTARPISKLLNPLAKGGGYSLAVALNFTQTKLEMPKNKQSCISTFFESQRRILKKMSSSEAPNADSVESTSSSTSTKPLASGAKRRHDVEFFTSEDQQHISVDEGRRETEAAVWQEQHETCQLPQSVFSKVREEQSEETYPPERKRMLIETSSVLGYSQAFPLVWSQDPLFKCSQDWDVEFKPINQNAAEHSHDSEQSVLNSLQSEEAFVFHMDAEGKTSTQKSPKHSPQINYEKENRSCASFSPSRRSPVSHLRALFSHKWTETAATSPVKHTAVRPRTKADRENTLNSQFRWAKQRSSSLKKTGTHQQVVEEEDSLASLFTQDSEGFKVIAHRGLRARSPLKDQSNTRRNCTYKRLVEEEEDEYDEEILFTQDSQGNVVIKH